MSSGSSLTAGSTHRDSTHSSHALQGPTPSQDHSSSKSSFELRVLDAQLPLDPELLTSHPRLPWYHRTRRQISARYPRAYTKLSRFLLYWRGPRPKYDLPCTDMLLNILIPPKLIFKLRSSTVAGYRLSLERNQHCPTHRIHDPANNKAINESMAIRRSCRCLYCRARILRPCAVFPHSK